MKCVLFILMMGASIAGNASQTLLKCRPSETNGGPLYRFDYTKDDEGQFLSVVTTEDGVEFTEKSSALEWHMKDLTLPNIENKAYRLRLSSEGAVWSLVEYTIDNLEYYYEMTCEFPVQPK